MTVRELMEQYKGQYVDVEVYRPKDYNHIVLHTDSIELVENPDPERTVDLTESYLCSEKEYDNTVLSNSSERADFGMWYDDADAKVLVILYAEPADINYYEVVTIIETSSEDREEFIEYKGLSEEEAEKSAAERAAYYDSLPIKEQNKMRIAVRTYRMPEDIRTDEELFDRCICYGDFDEDIVRDEFNRPYRLYIALKHNMDTVEAVASIAEGLDKISGYSNPDMYCIVNEELEPVTYTFSYIKQLSGMTISELSRFFSIPDRTLYGWNNESRDCPEYLLRLMEYRLTH